MSSKNKRVHESNDFKCVVCGKPGTRNNPLTVHHKRPKSRNGGNNEENLVSWHRDFHQNYHQEHGLQTSDDFGNPVEDEGNRWRNKSKRKKRRRR